MKSAQPPRRRAAPVMQTPAMAVRRIMLDFFQVRVRTEGVKHPLRLRSQALLPSECRPVWRAACSPASLSNLGAEVGQGMSENEGKPPSEGPPQGKDAGNDFSEVSFQRLGQRIADLSRELSDITKLAGTAAPRKLELEAATNAFKSLADAYAKQP